jgi:UPF0716 protein FxsA
MFFIPLPIVLIEVLIFATFVHFYNFWDVFLCYLLPSFLGTVMFSLMGRSMMLSLQGGFSGGHMPGDKMLHRGAILVGSILLIIPMFLSRVLALLLILPIFRHISIFIFKTFIFKRLAKSQFSFIRFGGGPGGFGRGPQGSTFSFEQEVRNERDAEVVDVTPIEITHTKIEAEAPKKKDDSSGH